MSLLGIPLAIFLVGFVIGLAAFSKSRAQIGYAMLCGFAAVLVSVAVFFAGCALLLSNARF